MGYPGFRFRLGCFYIFSLDVVSTGGHFLRGSLGVLLSFLTWCRLDRGVFPWRFGLMWIMGFQADWGGIEFGLWLWKKKHKGGVAGGWVWPRLSVLARRSLADSSTSFRGGRLKTGWMDVGTLCSRFFHFLELIGVIGAVLHDNSEGFFVSLGGF